MAELLLINPRHRRRASVKRARRNPRRRRRRAMTALQRQYFGGRRARRLTRNPRRRRRYHAMRRNPRRVRRFRRNPSFARARAYVRGARFPTTVGGIMDMIIPASIGAAGALALDMAWGSLPLPATLTTGTLAPVTRIAGAIGIGVVVGMVAGRRNGALAGAGALTVTMYDLIKPYVASAFPQVPGLGYWSPARQHLGSYVGAYVR